MEYYSGRVLNGPHKGQWATSYAPFVRIAIMDHEFSFMPIGETPSTVAVKTIDYQWDPTEKGWTCTDE